MITYHVTEKFLSDITALERELSDMATIKTGNLYRIYFSDKFVSEDRDSEVKNCRMEIIFPSQVSKTNHGVPIARFMRELGIPYREYNYWNELAENFSHIDPKSINIVFRSSLAKEVKILSAIIRSFVFSVERKVVLDESKGKVVYEKFADKLDKFSTRKDTEAALIKLKEKQVAEIAAIQAAQAVSANRPRRSLAAEGYMSNFTTSAITTTA